MEVKSEEIEEWSNLKMSQVMAREERKELFIFFCR